MVRGGFEDKGGCSSNTQGTIFGENLAPLSAQLSCGQLLPGLLNLFGVVEEPLIGLCAPGGSDMACMIVKDISVSSVRAPPR